MRTVVETDEVAHLWAHQSQSEARNSRANYSFRGELLYSYNTVIGRIVERKGKGRAVLLGTSRHSSTTNRHQSFAARATSHLPQFHVPGGFDRFGAPPNKNTHAENLKSYGERIAELVGKAVRARTNGEWHKQEAERLTNEANKYITYFGLRNKRFTLPDKLDGDAWKAIQTEQEAARKRETAKQTKLRAEREAAAKADYEKRRAEYLANLERWTAGEDVELPRGWYRQGPEQLDRMRVKGSRVQTTQGAIVSVADVRAQLPVVLSALRNLPCAPGTQHHFDNFTVGPYGGAYIDHERDGAVILRVGCHRFGAAEVERIAEIIGTLPAELPEDLLPLDLAGVS